MATKWVEVTQERIDAGERDNCEACPVALAVLAVVAEGVVVSVDGVSVALRLWGDDKFHHIVTPARAEGFIDAFDASRPVAPFRFPLDIPDRYLAPAAVQP